MESGSAKEKLTTDNFTRPSLPDLSKASPDERARLEWETMKLRVDTYKWRAEEYRSRYEGLRTLEWNTILQIYAGYAAIALAFKYLKDSAKLDQQPLIWTAVIITSAFYFCTRYLNYRIQERLVRFGQTLENYANKLGEFLHIDPPNPGTDSLHHPYYWTYDTQLILSTITFAGLIGYQMWDILPKMWCIGAVFIICTIALCIIGLTYTPTRRTQMLVWYASYGSNLRRQRFMCYIKGGIADGRTEPNEGCRDKNPPLDSKPISLNFDLYFAGKSESWGGGGVAFIKDGTKESLTLGRMYLITYEQFNDVVMQENSKKINGKLFVPPFQQLVRQRESLLPGNPWYGKLLNIGTEADHPILTFTTATDLKPNPNAPSKQYRETIASGLKETYPQMTDTEIAEYLDERAGHL